MKINSRKFKSKIIRVLVLAFGWVIYYWYIFIINSYSENTVFEMISAKLDMKPNMLVSTFNIFIAGIIIASVEVFYFTNRFKKKSFAYAVLMKCLFYAVILSIISIVINYVDSSINSERPNYFYNNIIESLGVIFFIWAPVFILSIFLLQVSDRYGRGVLLKFILGKYHAPKQEMRIFMFLDMKSSTTIAETLGNVKYYELLNDFFYDVTDAILENDGEIYQYVGDEIVISWKVKLNSDNKNSLYCFFDIQESIRYNFEKYLSNYGLVPEFKAGIHYGEVTMGEVGVMKKEITFSGDVLNTTSRIQELCNRYNVSFIASKDYLDLVKAGSDFKIEELGEMNLRGRSVPVILYSVKKT